MPVTTDLQTIVSDEEANKTTVSNRVVTARIINDNNCREALQANLQETFMETVPPLSSDIGIYFHNVAINEVSENSKA